MDVLVFLALAVAAGGAWARSEPRRCSAAADTGAGAVCGRCRVAADGTVYASFRGIPYAKQPLGELRFKELQPVEPWSSVLDAAEEGPACPQLDTFYAAVTSPRRATAEDCIYANVHAPLSALPAARAPPAPASPGLPVLVFVHGGGFAFGSGDADLHGPEYLVTKGVVVVTFNYRLNVFGFLSLNSSYVPGNNGLRDVITLLRWVQDNAANFGGNPDDVTLAGQSAGAVITHLLSMAPAADGLFHRMILSSGNGSPTFYSASPIIAKTVADAFLQLVGVNSTDPEDTHQQLVEMPLEKLMEANAILQNLYGVVVFAPVVETSAASDFTTVIDEDPDVMINQGRGNHIPALIGFTSAEAEMFRPLFDSIKIVDKVRDNPTLAVYPKMLTRVMPDVVADIGKKIQQRYYPTITLDNYIKYASDAFFIYPALKLAKTRAYQRAAPTYLYQFSYQNDNSTMKRANHLSYSGAAHVEDLTYWFRTNTQLPPPTLHVPTKEDPMVNRMTWFISNFIHCGTPSCDRTSWTPLRREYFTYQDIAHHDSREYRSVHLADTQHQMYQFFHNIENRSS